jgi:GTP-binding protein
MAKLATPKLTRALQAAVAQQQPPMAGRFRPKMRYAHQGGSNPPIVVIHGTGLDGIKAPYKRYLEGTFRKAFHLTGTPLRIELRSAANPFEGRKKPLTEKQDSQRRRRKIISKRRYG